MIVDHYYALAFQHSPRDLANVNEWKIIFDPYNAENQARQPAVHVMSLFNNFGNGLAGHV